MVRQIADLAALDTELVERVLFSDGLQARFEVGECTPREYYQQFCQLTASSPDVDAFAEAGNAIFALNHSMLPLVERLGERGYRMGVLSNTCENHWNYISNGQFSMLPGPFETAVLSYEERSMKPDRRIYESAVERAGAPADRVFFVDDRHENVAAAQQLGIDAIRFEGVRRLAASLRDRGIDC